MAELSAAANVRPDRCQLLLKVDMIDCDDEVVEVACVAHRLPRPVSDVAPSRA